MQHLAEREGEGMTYKGTDEQLANALEHIASRKSTGVTDAAVCQAAADRLRALAGGPEREIRLLEGPIEVGREFIWEPSLPDARCHVIVTRVVAMEGDETRIWAHEVGKPPGTAVWNDESRFREACVRIEK
jgi:hypothetical protein